MGRKGGQHCSPGHVAWESGTVEMDTQRSSIHCLRPRMMEQAGGKSIAYFIQEP